MIHTRKPRIKESFDLDWLFYYGNAQNAETVNYPDDTWRRLELPHDWSIEGEFDENNPTGGSGGYLPAGIGWYRKHFFIPESFSSKKIYIEFDGVYMNASVYINGHSLGLP